MRQFVAAAHFVQLDQVRLFFLFQAAEDGGDTGLAVGFHLVGEFLVALGGLGLHGQRVRQQFRQAVDRGVGLRVAHSANLASSSATEPSVCSNSGRKGGRLPLNSTLPTLKPSSVINRRAARAASSV
jgi:hypothetical protein